MKSSNNKNFDSSVIKYTAGLKSHMRMHRCNVNNKDSYLVCHICNRACKNEFALKSHTLPGAFSRTEMAAFCKEVVVTIIDYSLECFVLKIKKKKKKLTYS